MGLDLADALLAIEGGTAQLRLVLDIGETRLVASSGPCELVSDFDRGIKAIKDGLGGIAQTAGTRATSLNDVPAYLALAGVTDSDIARRTLDALPLTRARIADRRHAIVMGALAGQDGAVAYCGLSAFVGTLEQGQTRLAGGWGPLLGDKASSPWITVEALAGTLASHDELSEPSSLTQHLMTKFGSARGITDFMRRASAHQIGALASEVTAAALSGDPLARRIMTEGAEHIERTLNKMGWHPGDTLCLDGDSGPSLAPYLSPAASAGLMDPQGKPIDGALALARRFKEETQS